MEASTSEITPDETLPDGVDWTARHVLSRFAVFRKHTGGDGFLVETPEPNGCIAIPNVEVVKLLHALSTPLPLDAVLQQAGGRRDVIATLLAQFVNAGVLVPVDEDGTPADETGTRMSWETHDLFFHSRSRAGRTPFPIGGTYRFDNDDGMPPAVAAPASAGAAVNLPKPDLDALRASDPSLTAVHEARSSCRSYDGPPSMQELGELLFRTCRVTRLLETKGGTVAQRPYPSGGSRHPLDVYIVTNQVDALDAGVHYYDPVEHALQCCSTEEESVRTLLTDAQQAAGMDAPPPVLLCIAARFGRTAWKYQSIAYALILKEVGVLYQSLWLAVEAMGLGGCGLGSGNADVFARAIDTDYYAQSSVGEFIVGTPAE